MPLQGAQFLNLYKGSDPHLDPTVLSPSVLGRGLNSKYPPQVSRGIITSPNPCIWDLVADAMPPSYVEPIASAGDVQTPDQSVTAESSSKSSLSNNDSSTPARKISSDDTSTMVVVATSSPHKVTLELGPVHGYKVTVDRLMQSNDEYTRYIEKQLAAAEFPSLQVVLDFLDSTSYDSGLHLEQHGASLVGVLARHLYDVLIRLMKPNKQATEYVSSGYSSSPSRQTDERAALSEFFVETFIHALRFKAKLFLSHNKYRLVFFHPGDHFCPDRMIREEDTFGQFAPGEWGRDSLHTRTWKLRVAPPLNYASFRLSTSRQMERATWSRATAVMSNTLVNNCNFIINDTVEGDQGFVLVAKAVVLI